MIYLKMKEIRQNKEDTQDKIAKILGVSRSTYAGWENGIDNIPLLKLNDFCNYYKVSLDYICGLTNVKKIDILNKEIDSVIIGNNLKDVRLKKNDTQESIANIIQVDQSNYSKYELGKILIHTYPLIEFAKHYNISIDWLCGKKENFNID